MNQLKIAGLATALSVAGAVATFPLSASAAETIAWDSSATHLRAQIGQTFSFICPSGGSIGPVKGSVIYTDDSSICSAAVHAGKITATSGGAVTISILPGQPVYPGVAVNGVNSQNHMNGNGSFIFFDTEEFAQSVAEDIETARAEEGKPMKVYWRFDLREYLDPIYLGEEFTFNCMPDNVVSDTVWGTDVYLGDSSVCYAAVHSGLINMEDGGEVTLRIGRGQASYRGSSRGGIRSEDYASRDVYEEISFTFVR